MNKKEKDNALNELITEVFDGDFRLLLQFLADRMDDEAEEQRHIAEEDYRLKPSAYASYIAEAKAFNKHAKKIRAMAEDFPEQITTK